MMKPSVFVAGWLLLGVSVIGVAQPPREREGRRDESVRTTEILKAKSILGAKISIQGDLSVGTVEDIVFTQDGCADYLVVLNEGKYVLVPWEAAKFNFERRTATVNITQEKFREVPTFVQERWPDVYDPAYRERIYTYYGVKSIPPRRLERRLRR